MEVTVSLKNAPSGCEWQMAVYDWNETEHISNFGLSFNESAIYNIPSGWVFPLRVDILIYNPDTYQIYYRMHSTSDSFPQYHKDIFIEDFGEYYFDLATEQFESLAPEPTSIEITAPSSAEEGSVVPISTEVTNITADSRLFRVELYAVRDIYAVPTSEETIGSLEVVIKSGQSQLVSGTFIMPAWDTTVLVMVYRFIDYWDFDNSATKVVSLEVLVEEFAGSIVRKELEYNESRKAIPVY